MKFMSSEETLEMTDEGDLFNTREALLLQKCRANDEVIERWHILSPKFGRLSSRNTACQYSQFHGPAHCPSRTPVRQLLRHIGLLDEY